MDTSGVWSACTASSVFYQKSLFKSATSIRCDDKIYISPNDPNLQFSEELGSDAVFENKL